MAKKKEEIEESGKFKIASYRVASFLHKGVIHRLTPPARGSKAPNYMLTDDRKLAEFCSNSTRFEVEGL